MAEAQRTVINDERAANQLASPARSNLDDIQHRQHVDNSCGGDEARAVISRGTRNVGTGCLEHARQIIKDARARIRQKTERAEWIAGVRREHVAAQQIASDHQSTHRGEKYQRSAPTPQQQMSETWNQPCSNRCEQRKGGASGGGSE